MSFQKVLSLGAYCQVAYQIERRFNYPDKGPFDWLVTPYEGLLAILDDNGARLGHSMSPLNGGESVVCNSYGVSYHHEVDRRPDGTVIFRNDTVSNCISKMKHKWGLFLDALGGDGPALFLRYGTWTDVPIAHPYLEQTRTMGISDINRLPAALRSFRAGLDFRVCVVHHPSIHPITEDAQLDPSIDIIGLPLPGIRTWQGDDAQWDEVFGRYQFAPG